ncbi:MAG: phosphate/phosphite/phosphonate ABC transporter substrate-binding protein [Proteobacteria bacterium]|jgi:phosphonate transport system substrate-binding protein|nr:phosphate/phosphite/phosphonate ABC transporter substrate-binding protein [Pseudomonadota bacterium]
MIKNCKLLIVFFLLIFSNLSLAETEPPKVVIGFIPGGKLEAIKTGGAKIAGELEKTLNVKVEVYVPQTYGELIQAIQQKKVDFAFFTAATYVHAEAVTSMKVLLKKMWAEPFYFSTLLVPQSSRLKTVQSLKGQRIAFVDRNSTSGFLYPMVYFKRNKISEASFSEVVFSGNHADSVALLEDKKVDVIAVFSDDKSSAKSAFEKYKKTSMKVRSLWVSEPIPNDPFVVRQDFYEKYPKLTHNLMFNLIDVAEKLKEDKEVLDFLGARGFMPATTRQYDPVREMVKEMKIQQ